jgi:hypothetical protein
MTEIAATSLKIRTTTDTIREFFDNMANLKQIMPKQVEQWKSDESSCSFYIKNLGELSMQKKLIDEPCVISFSSTDDSKVKFLLNFNFEKSEDKYISGYFEINAEMSPMAALLATRPLTNFVNILTENLQKNIVSD